MNELYQRKQIAFLTLDPVHVGAGGYRLGRVDMTIVREPGTNLPKIPGTSLAGAARSYAAMQYGKIAAAGQQLKLKRRDLKCPILYTFGTSGDKPNEAHAGSISISDALLFLFPVASAAGPVWVSTPERLLSAGFQVSGGSPDATGQVAVTLDNQTKPISLGWLLLPVAAQKAVVVPPAHLNTPIFLDVVKRIALVDPKFFSMIVNNHLEVRTSVAINPETGAAEDTALFTYEAIPRGSWLLSEVVLDNYLELAGKAFEKTTNKYRTSDDSDNAGEPLPTPWNNPLDVLRSGLGLIEFLGVGGMGTRGFGRMKMFAGWEVSN